MGLPHGYWTLNEAFIPATLSKQYDHLVISPGKYLNGKRWFVVLVQAQGIDSNHHFHSTSLTHNSLLDSSFAHTNRETFQQSFNSKMSQIKCPTNEKERDGGKLTILFSLLELHNLSSDSSFRQMIENLRHCCKLNQNVGERKRGKYREKGRWRAKKKRRKRKREIPKITKFLRLSCDIRPSAALIENSIRVSHWCVFHEQQQLNQQSKLRDDIEAASHWLRKSFKDSLE